MKKISAVIIILGALIVGLILYKQPASTAEKFIGVAGKTVFEYSTDGTKKTVMTLSKEGNLQMSSSGDVLAWSEMPEGLGAPAERQEPSFVFFRSSGQRVQLPDKVEVNNYDSFLSPDGKKIVFSKGTLQKSSLQLYDIATGKETTIVNDFSNWKTYGDGGEKILLGWSKDSKEILYASTKLNQSKSSLDLTEIYKYSLVSSTVSLVLKYSDVCDRQSSLDLAGNGDRVVLAYCQDDDKSNKISVKSVGLKNKQVTNLISGDKYLEIDSYQNISPDGRYYVHEKRGEWIPILLDTKTGKSEKLKISGGTGSFKAFSPRSDKLFFSVDRNGTSGSIYDLKSKTVTDFKEKDFHFISWIGN